MSYLGPCGIFSLHAVLTLEKTRSAVKSFTHSEENFFIACSGQFEIGPRQFPARAHFEAVATDLSLFNFATNFFDWHDSGGNTALFSRFLAFEICLAGYVHRSRVS